MNGWGRSHREMSKSAKRQCVKAVMQEGLSGSSFRAVTGTILSSVILYKMGYEFSICCTARQDLHLAGKVAFSDRWTSGGWLTSAEDSNALNESRSWVVARILLGNRHRLRFHSAGAPFHAHSTGLNRIGTPRFSACSGACSSATLLPYTVTSCQIVLAKWSFILLNWKRHRAEHLRNILTAGVAYLERITLSRHKSWF